jgi:hypothetical protein
MAIRIRKANYGEDVPPWRGKAAGRCQRKMKALLSSLEKASALNRDIGTVDRQVNKVLTALVNIPNDHSNRFLPSKPISYFASKAQSRGPPPRQAAMHNRPEWEVERRAHGLLSGQACYSSSGITKHSAEWQRIEGQVGF